MARYKMTVVFDVNEGIEMRPRFVETIVRDTDIRDLDHKVVKTSEDYDDRQPHINKLYEDVLERIETSPKHPITYDIVSFEKLREE
jgi:hypothetical protein